jgi:hypothetical protein
MKRLDTEAKQLITNNNTIFTIVVCGSIFNISWESLVSDGPSNFFTRHFNKAGSRKIHIERSPDSFELIFRHLRGYPVVAKNELQHQDLLNDAHYFGLQKLYQTLQQFVYVNVGGTTFRLRWDLFNKGKQKKKKKKKCLKKKNLIIYLIWSAQLFYWTFETCSTFTTSIYR